MSIKEFLLPLWGAQIVACLFISLSSILPHGYQNLEVLLFIIGIVSFVAIVAFWMKHITKNIEIKW